MSSKLKTAVISMVHCFGMGVFLHVTFFVHYHNLRIACRALSDFVLYSAGVGESEKAAYRA